MSGWPRLLAVGLVRIGATVVLVAVVATLLAEAAPGSPRERAARAAGVMPPADAPIPDRLREQLLDEVARRNQLEAGIGARLASAVRLELGRSWVDGRAVRDRLIDAAPKTAALVVLGLGVALLIGLGAGIAGGRQPGGRFDVVLGGLAALAISVPPVWLAILALRTFAAGEPFAWFPIGGAAGGLGLVLPVLVLSVVPGFVIARHLRAALVQARVRPYAMAARARGAGEWRVLWRHCLRVELVELLPLAVALTAYLFGAAVVVEELFGLAGLGSTLVDAANRGDQPLVVGACVLVAAAIASVSVAVDLARHWLDPRPGGRR